MASKHRPSSCAANRIDLPPLRSQMVQTTAAYWLKNSAGPADYAEFAHWFGNAPRPMTDAEKADEEFNKKLVERREEQVRAADYLSIASS